ncbi:MAG: glycoside hydrolase family 3 N-terminal domain-containing protein, partial [Caulobacteraceae bacterium]
MSEPSAEPPVPFSDPTLGLEERVNGFVTRLALKEKVALMAGSAAFTLEGCARLGMPRLRVTDGPTGVRSHEGEAATVFPVGVTIASTWNPDLTGEVAAAIAREALALGNQVVLAPTINIVRTPLWGRNFETWSEDPYLTGELGVAFVEGLQGEGVGASLKHFAANNQEVDRMTLDVRMDERTLREIYLAAFETVVRRANPWTVMAAYNKLDGTHASENPRLLTEILKGEWKYDGVVVSDWGAIHSTAPSATAGMDLEMPGPSRWFGEKLIAAVRRGEVAMSRIDDAARRIARLILRTGILHGPPRPRELRTARHRQIAARAAEEGTILLRNEGDLLPFDPGALRSVAVVGPNAAARRIQGGGSSQVRPGRRIYLLQAIEETLAGRCDLVHADGGDNEPVPPAARPERFSPDEARSEAGLLVEYFAGPDCVGSPLRAGVERRIGKLIATGFGDGRRPDFEACRWRGWFWPEKDGRHEFGVRAGGAARLILDGAVLIDEATPALSSREDVGGAAVPHRIAARDLLGGRGYPITIEYRRTPESRRLMWETIVVGVRAPRGSIAEAAAIAATADAAIVVIGAASTTEGEGYDRETLDLPGDQDALIEAVLAANPRTAVVLIGGAPYA